MSNTTSDNPRTRLTDAFRKKVLKRKIVEVEYDEQNYPVIRLDDGSAIWIQRDDENNGPGVPVHIHVQVGGSNQVETGMWELH